MTIRLRFAPSPTGYLHLGNMRAALINYLYAKKNDGTFFLRIDDTDHERSKPEYVEALKEDLQWLGIRWDDEFAQSTRFERYNEAVEYLKSIGRLYPCFETPEELEFYRKQRLGRKLPPIYNRKALDLTDEQKQKLEAEGRKPHWRFKLDDAKMEWEDLIRGHCHFEAKNVSDPVLIREDGVPLYTLPSVVDDLEYEITHVIRGEDHVTNTAVQLQIIEALKPFLKRENHTIQFAHFSYMTTVEGEGFSKRKGSLSIRQLREKHMLPMTVNSYLARLGTSADVVPRQTLGEVVENFDIGQFTRSNPKVKEEELWQLNEKLIHSMSFADIEALGILPKGITETFWESVKGNLASVDEIESYYNICFGEIAPAIDEEDKEYLAEAQQALDDVAQWDEGTWGEWTSKLKTLSGRKGKGLFMPLRKAITGMAHGPEMKVLLPLIPREKVIARLKGESA